MTPPAPSRLCLGVALGLSASLAGQAAPPAAPASVDAVPALGSPAWQARDVGVGLRLHRLGEPRLFGRPQSVTVLEIDPSEVSFHVAAPDPWGRRPTSQLVRNHEGAVAAINGGFFNTRTGEPSGWIVQEGSVRHAPTGRDEEAAVVVTAGQPARLDFRFDAAALPDLREALSAWPVLLRDGAVAREGGFDPEGARHPRSMIGWTAGESPRILLCAVDGRHDEAAGMTFHEQAELLRALGCEDALNLDGGGSTTLWARTAGGIVNHPSDNRRFDPAGERAVANALVLVGRAVFTQDEEQARTDPEQTCDPLESADALFGDALRIQGTGKQAAWAEFRVPVPRRSAATAGWTVEVHLPARGRDDPAALRVTCGTEERRCALPERTGWIEVGRVPPAAEPLVIRWSAASPGDALLVDAVRTIEQNRPGR